MCLLMPHMFDTTKLGGNSTRMNGLTLQCYSAYHRHSTHARSACEIARRLRLRTLRALHRGHVRGAFRCKPLHGSSPRRVDTQILRQLEKIRDCCCGYVARLRWFSGDRTTWLLTCFDPGRVRTHRSSQDCNRACSRAAHCRSRRPTEQQRRIHLQRWHLARETQRGCHFSGTALRHHTTRPARQENALQGNSLKPQEIISQERHSDAGPKTFVARALGSHCPVVAHAGGREISDGQSCRR
jgi:hypothetical protein